ncbi:MAG: hypothetical protein IPH77_14615 [Ignavibacteria bacterium]|nr:hypothetical protein [Ignavibacteria bacterium]
MRSISITAVVSADALSSAPGLYCSMAYHHTSADDDVLIRIFITGFFVKHVGDIGN